MSLFLVLTIQKGKWLLVYHHTHTHIAHIVNGLELRFLKLIYETHLERLLKHRLPGLGLRISNLEVGQNCTRESAFLSAQLLLMMIRDHTLRTSGAPSSWNLKIIWTTKLQAIDNQDIFQSQHKIISLCTKHIRK